jgi:hypothetical protein
VDVDTLEAQADLEFLVLGRSGFGVILTWPEFKKPKVAICGATDLMSTDLQMIAGSFPPLETRQYAHSKGG